MHTLRALAVALALATLPACGHSYAAPVAVSVQTGPDQSSDVAWVIEDGGRIVRCVGGPDRPRCRRADVD